MICSECEERGCWTAALEKLGALMTESWGNACYVIRMRVCGEGDVPNLGFFV